MRIINPRGRDARIQTLIRLFISDEEHVQYVSTCKLISLSFSPADTLVYASLSTQSLLAALLTHFFLYYCMYSVSNGWVYKPLFFFIFFLQNAISVNFNRVKPDVQNWKMYLSFWIESVCHYFLKACVFALYFLKLVIGLGSETCQATLSWYNHTVFPCPCTLSCERFLPSRNALPIMRVRGQSAAAPGGRDLLGSFSHWLCPYI